MEKFKSNICYAVGVGALKTIVVTLEQNTRQRGVCSRLIRQMEKRATYLPNINSDDITTISKCIKASSEVLATFESKYHKHILLNLVAFCMEEIKPMLTDNNFFTLQKMFECFKGVDCYHDIRLGDTVFTRMMTEIEIEKSML